MQKLNKFWTVQFETFELYDAEFIFIFWIVIFEGHKMKNQII